ncbi:hypothetical protein D3P06_14055 [Paracoccus aestuarii]|uniref:HTH-like domain-containing protein n=1 Tax=Paracoccus aestuarii TaxID=453842 RepID=A0A418ZSD5_9RHOB|nr:hypothetical protein D3P06_14055 [Paracoccus aestuarii]
MNLDLMLLIDKQFLDTPFYVVRQMTWHLQNEGHAVNQRRIRRLMRRTLRCQSSPRLLRQDNPAPSEPRRRQGGQQRTAHHRNLPNAPRPADEGIRGQSHRHGTFKARSHQDDQTIHRP